MPARWPDSGLSSAADHAACTALLRGGSRTFYAASLVLPRELRRGATALYAFCRLADDAVDVDGGRLVALGELRERLARAYDGRPAAIAADRAFADAVAHFHVPRALPEALLEGFEWDARGRRYRTFPELTAYASRVAGTVGAMMAVLMGVRTREVLARACDLGVAMQFTNIARDVGEDARAGRLYLPIDWLEEEGIDADAWLSAPVFDAGVGRVVERLLAEAEVLYRRAASGIPALPRSCRPGMQAARLIYADIGREVAASGFDSVSRRAIVPGTRKAWLLAVSLLAAVRPVARDTSPALPETHFLVEASLLAGLNPAGAAARKSLDDRVAWLVDLFERLEVREQSPGAS